MSTHPIQDNAGAATLPARKVADADQLRAFAAHTWTKVSRRRPDITHLVHPIIGWLYQDMEPDVAIMLMQSPTLRSACNTLAEGWEAQALAQREDSAYSPPTSRSPGMPCT